MTLLPSQTPFVLSLSMGCFSFLRHRSAAQRTEQCFDKLSMSGFLIAGLGFGLGLCLAAPALAQATADLDAVDRAVAQFTGAPLGQPGGAAMPTDRRLRLAQCLVPLALSWHGLRRESVEVLCPMPGGWKLYVPLAGASSAALQQSDAITRGDAVTVTVMGDGFAVSQSGEAMESGPVGAWIKVRTVSAGGPVLRGKVLRPGAVGIDLP